MNHKDLDAWKLSVERVGDVYRLTREFPGSERYGLTAQGRRASVPVPSNSSEGAARSSPKEVDCFLGGGVGFLTELETQVLLAGRLGYGEPDAALEKLSRVRALFIGFDRSVRSRKGAPDA